MILGYPHFRKTTIELYVDEICFPWPAVMGSQIRPGSGPARRPLRASWGPSHLLVQFRCWKVLGCVFVLFFRWQSPCLNIPILGPKFSHWNTLHQKLRHWLMNMWYISMSMRKLSMFIPVGALVLFTSNTHTHTEHSSARSRRRASKNLPQDSLHKRRWFQCAHKVRRHWRNPCLSTWETQTCYFNKG